MSEGLEFQISGDLIPTVSSPLIAAHLHVGKMKLSV